MRAATAAVLAGTGLALIGCTLDATGISDRTTSRPDGAVGMDAAVYGADAGRDAGPGVDAGAFDAGFDAGGVDAGFDAGPFDAGPAPPCVVTFSGYHQCGETDTECRIFRDDGWRSCNDVCGSRGRSCVRAHQEGGGPCDTLVEYPCSWDALSQICTCSR